MKKIFLAAVMCAGTMAIAATALATINTTTASETMGLAKISVTRPSISESLPETTTLDPQALAAKGPKVRSDDNIVPIRAVLPEKKGMDAGKPLEKKMNQ